MPIPGLCAGYTLKVCQVNILPTSDALGKGGYWLKVNRFTKGLIMSELNPKYSGEVQFAGYTDSSRNGPRVTFRLDDRSDLEQFVGMEGKRYMLAIVEIGDDEEPVQQPHERLGPLCQWAVMRCKEPKFWDYLEEHNQIPSIESEKEASECLKKMYGINSRKELDSYSTSAIFKALMKQYNQWLQRQVVAA